MKRFISLILALLMTAVLAQPVIAATKVQSASMRLTAAEGTVKVTNKNGQSLTVKADMKLYNGYIITTSAKSYAYISIDGNKAIKLDAGTKAEIRSVGKKLEIKVVKGKIFCNVKIPLKKDETLKISTSTTITGIRGTSLSISCEDEQTQVQVYSGQVATALYDALGQTAREMDVEAGGKLTADPSHSGEALLEELAMDDIPGFVAMLLKDDPDLRKIMDDIGIDAAELAERAEDILKKDQDAKGDKDVYDSREPGTEQPDPDPKPDAWRWEAIDISAGGEVLQQMLNDPSVFGVNLYSSRFGETGIEVYNLIIPAGTKLETQGMDLIVGGTLTVEGTLVLNRGYGYSDRDGSVQADSLENSGEIRVENGVLTVLDRNLIVEPVEVLTE